MSDLSAYEAMGQDIWSREIAPAFTDTLVGMGRLWRATEEGTEERRAVMKMVDLWGETYEVCREKIGEEFPSVGERWNALKDIRERLGLDAD